MQEAWTTHLWVKDQGVEMAFEIARRLYSESRREAVPLKTPKLPTRPKHGVRPVWQLGRKKIPGRQARRVTRRTGDEASLALTMASLSQPVSRRRNSLARLSM